MDLVGEDVHSLNAPDAESCARHCYVTAECDSFTFLNYGCYLKRKPTSSRYLKDSVSAELSCIFPGATTTPCCPECFEYNVDFFGNDFYTCNVASPQLCRTICSAKVECKAFTFKETTAPVNCYLKRSDSGRVQIQGAISGYPCWSN
ncbi:MAG: uncharacterized protein KVP18_003011 [Porospora cf. gigantea A]|uniref:uncharacterized protein n=1 Tax=Porospora cf. gigantea A TaxID=2853593 RepID=UPI00355AA5F2|nr:MAG: hypothetical protein KVP18_003011 [Porospora cf. gigantea A]